MRPRRPMTSLGPGTVTSQRETASSVRISLHQPGNIETNDIHTDLYSFNLILTFFRQVLFGIMLLWDIYEYYKFYLCTEFSPRGTQSLVTWSRMLCLTGAGWCRPPPGSAHCHWRPRCSRGRAPPPTGSSPRPPAPRPPARTGPWVPRSHPENSRTIMFLYTNFSTSFPFYWEAQVHDTIIAFVYGLVQF